MDDCHKPSSKRASWNEWISPATSFVRARILKPRGYHLPHASSERASWSHGDITCRTPLPNAHLGATGISPATSLLPSAHLGAGGKTGVPGSSPTRVTMPPKFSRADLARSPLSDGGAVKARRALARRATLSVTVPLSKSCGHHRTVDADDATDAWRVSRKPPSTPPALPTGCAPRVCANAKRTALAHKHSDKALAQLEARAS